MSLTFKQRIMGAVLLAAMLPMALVSGVAIYTSYHTARQLAQDGIEAVTEGTGKRMESYFKMTQGQLREQARNPMVHQALKDFTAAENAFDPSGVSVDMAKLHERYAIQQEKTSGTTPAEADSWMPEDKRGQALQYLYITKNPNKLGEKQKMDAADDGSDYSRVHAKYHPTFRAYVDEFGMYDYFLIDAASGKVVYTNYKEIDFQSSVKDGVLANSPFSAVVRKALASNDSREVFFSDVLPYLPSYNDNAIFAAAPVVEEGKTIGAIAFQLPMERLTEVFTPLKSVGETVDGFIAGNDMTFKTPQTAENGKIGEKIPEGLQVILKSMWEGNTEKEMHHYLGSDGGPMTGAFHKVNVPGQSWIMVVGQDDAEMLDTTYRQMWIMVGMAASMVVVMSLFGFMLSNGLVKPVQQLARGFFSGAEKVGRASGQVGEAVSSMVAASEETSAQSKVVRKNSSEASGYVSSVSNAVEELNTSINDISQSIGETNLLIDDAVSKAQKTDEVVRSLGEASKKITEVVSLINDLAEQTNLLALNAAIEAARAGDAGRGFAVVADEVKKLASHTSQATVDIKEQVREILDVSEQSVKALHTVVEAIHKIRDNATTVSAAVEEQSGVAKQIAGSVRDAASRVQQVDENMNGIEQAANDTGVAADQVNGSSQEVQGAFEEMKRQMQKVLEAMGVKT